jgi:hypothetical protein
MPYKAIAINRNEAIEPEIEHSCLDIQVYSGDEYIDYVLNNIENGAWKNERLIWGCDKDKSDNTGGYFSNTKTIIFNKSAFFLSGKNDYSDIIILNNDKKEFIDLLEYKANHILRGELYAHPFPILTNVAKVEIDIYDYTTKHEKRGYWCGDRFTIIRDLHMIPDYYTNLSDICFSNNKMELVARKNVMRKKALSKKAVSTQSLSSINLTSLRSGDSKRNLMALLECSQEVNLYYNSGGTTLCSKATTFPSLLPDDWGLINGSNKDRDALFFFDIEVDKIKSFKFWEFIRAEQVY